MATSERPLRADARRNRERILESARDVLFEAGLDASIDDIAVRADVGVGTIYRRFGDREALVRAVTLDSVELLATSAEKAVVSGLTPDEAFTQFVHTAFQVRLGTLAVMLLPVMSTALRADADFRCRRDRLLTAVETLLQRAQAEGTLRGDIGAADVLLAVGKASRPLPGVPAEFESRQARRTVTFLLDGLLSQAPTEISGAPNTRADLDRALRDAWGGSGSAAPEGG